MDEQFIGREFITNSVDDTFSLGKDFGEQLQGGEVIEFIGDLGAGKTSFVRGLVDGLGSDDEVASPTFTISRLYKTHSGLSIYHFDFYRLQEDPGLVAEELAEASMDPKTIVCVEWAETVRDMLPSGRITIELVGMGDSEDKRTIKFNRV